MSVSMPRSAVFALLLAGHPAFAQGDATSVPPVVVSATRTAQTVDSTLASVSVITREDIERLQPRSVNDLLGGLPGVSFANSGGRGKNTSLFVRGAESDQVLVLIDGIKVGSATLGSYAFQDLPVEQIERIELVRGPRGSLYGSDAIGGVLQIFTRRGGGELKPSARVTAGSRNTLEASANISGGGEHGWFNLTGSADTTRGLNACRGSLVAGCFTIEPDHDSYRNRSVALRTGYRFDNDTEIDLHALAVKGDAEFDGSFQNESESRQRVLGSSLRFAPLDPWQVTLAGGFSRDENKNFKDAVFASEFVTLRDSVSWQNDISIGEQQLLTLGVDHQRDRISGSEPFAVRSRRNNGVFGQHLSNFGDHDLELSFRHDDNEQFGAANTGSAAWGWQLLQRLRVVTSYGTAFKAPTFNELYFPGFGNPNLSPEESRSGELGLSGSAGVARWGLNVYQSEVDDLISFDAALFAPNNIGSARIRGLEATLQTTIEDVLLSGSLTLLDPRNRDTGANFGNQLPRRPRQVLRLDADRDFGAYSLGMTVRAEGPRYDDLANTVRLGGFTTVDLRAAYRVTDQFSVEARIENLLDKDYQTADTFNQPGLGGFLTLRYQP